jgi:uncharacterized protein YecT (DUF1311 family)
MRSAAPVRVLLALLVAGLLPMAGHAEAEPVKQHPIDRQFDACVERDYSTAGMANCAYAAQEAWDKELNTRYAALLAALPAPEAEALRASQRRWLAYRDAEYGLIDEVFARLEGTMWIPVRVSHRSSLTEQRADDLQAYQEYLDETCMGDDDSPECAGTPLEEALPELDPLDRTFAECFFGEANTSEQVDCAYRAGEAWDARLNRGYDRLGAQLSAQARVALRDAQRRWIEFRDAEFTALDAIYRTKSGTMYHPLRVKARYEFVRARAVELETYHDLLEEGA